MAFLLIRQHKQNNEIIQKKIIKQQKKIYTYLYIIFLNTRESRKKLFFMELILVLKMSYYNIIRYDTILIKLFNSDLCT